MSCVTACETAIRYQSYRYINKHRVSEQFNAIIFVMNLSDEQRWMRPLNSERGQVLLQRETYKRRKMNVIKLERWEGCEERHGTLLVKAEC